MPTDRELVAAYGSPLFVYDLDRVCAAGEDLLAALPEPCTVYYSLKANPHPLIVAALRGAGCGAEVCSLGELDAAVRAGQPPARILYGGPGKTSGEIDHALRTGVREFSVESLSDLRRVGAHAVEHGVTARCLLRINAAAGPATSSIRMTGTPSQFGIDAETLPLVLPALLAVPGTTVTGLHFYPLSNARDEDALVTEFLASMESAAQLSDEHGLAVEVLDLGGGFAAPYTVPGTRPRYPKLRSELENALDLHFPSWREGCPRVAFESGRYLAADCGRLLCTVTNVKRSRGRTFVIVDAGVNHLGGMAGLGRLLPLAVTVDGVPREKVSLVGPLCTPGDLLGRDVPVPALAPGDLVSVPNAGAYGLTASLVGFLSRPPAAEVFLRGGEVVAATRLDLRRVPIGEAG